MSLRLYKGQWTHAAMSPMLKTMLGCGAKNHRKLRLNRVRRRKRLNEAILVQARLDQMLVSQLSKTAAQLNAAYCNTL